MSKKKIMAAVVSLSLAAVTMVGATLAYFQDKTNAVTNTFTVGDVKIDLVEPEWNPEDGENLLPGAEVSKNPMIINTGKSEGYMMLKVEGADDMVDFTVYTKTGEVDDDGNEISVAGYNYEDWTLVEADGTPIEVDSYDLVDGYYVYNKGAVEDGAATSPLFTSVKLNENAAELEVTTHVVVAMYTDKENDELFTYKDINGNAIEENANRVPETDANGVPVLTYVISNDEEAGTFESYEEAEAYVVENYREEASFIFDLVLTGYAIQADEMEFEESGVYTWVAELITENTVDAE